MNKEEIIKYLKEKIKTNQSFIKTIEKISNDSSKTKDDMIINSENDIKYYKEIINYIEEKEEQLNIMSEAFDELEHQKQDYTQINILEMKLEEKDKIIEEAKEYLIKLGKQPDADLYYCINQHKEYTELLEILIV